MTKSKLRNRPTRRKHAAPKPEKAASVPATPAAEAPKPEPTFTLAEFSTLMGENYSLTGGKGDPLTAAMNVIDDLRRVLFTVGTTMGADDKGLDELVTNAWARSKAALAVLERFGQHGSKAEVTP